MDYLGRQKRLATQIREHHLEALLVMHLPNIRYLCGFTGSAGVLALTASKTGESKAIFFTDGRYTQQAHEQVVGTSVEISNLSTMQAALGWLTKHRCRAVGLEAEHMTVASFAALKKLPTNGFRFRPTSGLVEKLRTIKEPSEVSQIKAAVNLASSVFAATLPDIRPGVTEASLAAEIEYMSRRLGAEGMSFDTLIAAGHRSAFPHGVASQQVLPARGFVILDFGVILGGYCSDMTRTVHLGEPDKTARRMYQAVLKSQLAGIKAVTPGVKCAEVDYATRKVLEKAGLGRYFTHSTGHGVGIEIHEPPGLRKAQRQTKIVGKPKNRHSTRTGTQIDTLLPGMVITIEPGVYIPGKGGVRIEDMVLVTEAGCEVLTPTPKELIVI